MFTTLKHRGLFGGYTSPPKTNAKWTHISRFIYDPRSINFNQEGPVRYRNCATVLVKKEVKDTIDSVFQEIFKVDIEYKMDTTYGEIISEVSKEICERA